MFALSQYADLSEHGLGVPTWAVNVAQQFSSALFG